LFLFFGFSKRKRPLPLLKRQGFRFAVGAAGHGPDPENEIALASVCRWAIIEEKQAKGGPADGHTGTFN
jgi:hypothetical protein